MMFLCVVVNEDSGKTLFEHEVEANNEPFAKHITKKLYREDPKYNSQVNWMVDCLLMD